MAASAPTASLLLAYSLSNLLHICCRPNHQGGEPSLGQDRPATPPTPTHTPCMRSNGLRL